MSKRIMAVDDESGALTLIEIVFKRHGFIVSTANNALAALDLLESQTPDLFILDVMMPGMDGIELCKHLRSRPELAKIPVIILSARSDAKSVNRGLEAGANAFLSKETLHSDLVTEVHKLLKMESSALGHVG